MLSPSEQNVSRTAREIFSLQHSSYNFFVNPPPGKKNSSSSVDSSFASGNFALFSSSFHDSLLNNGMSVLADGERRYLKGELKIVC